MDVKINSPLLPLRDIVVFPSMVIPLFVGRDKSISALNEVMKKDKKIVLVTQKNSEIDDPKKTDIFMCGCEGSILQLLKLPDGTVKVLVEGVRRVKILDFKDNEKFITCEFSPYKDIINKEEDLYPLAATAIRRLEKLTSINKKISSETINGIKQLKGPSQIADNIATHITASISEKQQIFETIDVKKRLNAIIKIMENETSIIGVEKRIRGRVKTQMEKTQREYYLNEQLKAIQKELGEIEEGKDENTSLNKSILKSKMPKDVEKKCLQELKKLKNMSPMSAEATVVRNYLDWMIELPWYKKSEVAIDLAKALDVLDKDHFGLEKVKERIIEFLAVQKRMDKIKGPILCLVYLAGEIHTNWREEIIENCKKQNLDIQFSSPVTDHPSSDDCGVEILGAEEKNIWKDRKGANINSIRTKKSIKESDVVVVKFGEKYKQWNAAFDAGYASALNKSIIVIQNEDHQHALKEIDAAASAVASDQMQVVRILKYVLEGTLK